MGAACPRLLASSPPPTTTRICLHLACRLPRPLARRSALPPGAAPQATPCLARVGEVGPGQGGRGSQCSPPSPPWPPEGPRQAASISFSPSFFLSLFTPSRER